MKHPLLSTGARSWNYPPRDSHRALLELGGGFQFVRTNARRFVPSMRGRLPPMGICATSRPQERDDRAPFGSVVAGSFAGGIGAGAAPKADIECGSGSAEINVAVSPQDIQTEWIL